MRAELGPRLQQDCRLERNWDSHVSVCVLDHEYAKQVHLNNDVREPSHPFHALLVRSMDDILSDRSVVEQLRAAVQQLSERGLLAASKWYAPFLSPTVQQNLNAITQGFGAIAIHSARAKRQPLRCSIALTTHRSSTSQDSRTPPPRPSDAVHTRGSATGRA